MNGQSDSNPISNDNDEVDVILLGVGTWGEDLSLRLLGAGLNVVGIEANLVGGECAYWACLPSKMMIRAANVVTLEGDVDLSGERLLVATGRKVYLRDLGLESAGIGGMEQRLEVDECMRVTAGIWAMGDIAGKGNHQI